MKINFTKLRILGYIYKLFNLNELKDLKIELVLTHFFLHKVERCWLFQIGILILEKVSP